MNRPGSWRRVDVTRDLLRQRGQPSGRRAPAPLQVEVAVEVEIVGVAPEEVAGVGRRRPGGCPVHDSGCHAALDDQLGAEPRSPVAARLADEPGLDWTAGRSGVNWPNHRARANGLPSWAQAKAVNRADSSGLSGILRRRTQTRSPTAACRDICWYGSIISTCTLSNGPASISRSSPSGSATMIPE